MLAQISNGTVYFGVNDVFENIDFTVSENERIAIVGRNGSGKSTLLKVLTEEVELSSGQYIKNNKKKTLLIALATLIIIIIDMI